MSTLPAATHLGSSYRPTSATGVQQSDTSPSQFVVADVVAVSQLESQPVVTELTTYNWSHTWLWYFSQHFCHPPTVYVEFTSSGMIIDNSTPSEAVVPVVDTSDPQQAAGDLESRVCIAMETARLTTLPVSEPAVNRRLQQLQREFQL